MTKILEVYWAENLVGQLIQTEHGELNFKYATTWLNSPESMAISCSLPLQEKTFTRKECQGFFQGLLPEGHNRLLIARILGISAHNDFSLLEKIGGECAGAITFVEPNPSKPIFKEKYHYLKARDLAKILRELPARPLLAGEEGVRLSLAGVQDKIAISIINDQIAIPLDDSPSTHIIKPAIHDYEGIIFNEAFCLNLAKRLGLNTANASVERVEEIDYLLIERFDRKIIPGPNNAETIIRLHQEDFCQALGILSDRKYQNEGGPSIAQCFALIREYSEVPVIDLQQLLNAIIFNFLIGNCDAHGKNFSLIIDKQCRLAPFYDLISTTYYEDLSTNMAMKIGGEYNINQITSQHFIKAAAEIGLTQAAMRHRLSEMALAMLSELHKGELHNAVTNKITESIEARCKKIV